MKKLFTLFCISLSVVAYAQPKNISQAIISTKTTVVSPDEDENAPPPAAGPNGEEVRIMRFGGDGETNSTTWLKNDLVKTFAETEMGRTTIIRDNSKKITTTIMEMMGKKFGFYATDEEQEAMRKRMDSMMQSRGNSNMPGAAPAAQKSDIVYLDETKKIAGYDCKKAILVSTRSNGKMDSSTVWYTPEFKLQGVTNTGGSFFGFGGPRQQTGSGGLELLNGFPMQYERNMGRGRKMTVVVTKLVTDKDIADKEFEMPKDIEIKPMKDMQNGGMPGTFQMRMGGRD